MSVQAKPYGYGLFIESGQDWRLGNDFKIVTHGGATTGYRAQISMLDGGAYTIVLLGNSNISRSGGLAHSIANFLYEQQPDPGNILGTAVAWRLASEGKAAALALFNESKAKGFKNYLHNDYAYFSYAGNFLELNKISLAMEIIEIGLEAFPLSVSLHMVLGDSYLANKQSEKAKSVYKKAMDLAEKEPKTNDRLKQQLIKKLASLKTS